MLSLNSIVRELPGEVAKELPGKFGELLGKSGDFPEARGSLTPSQRVKLTQNMGHLFGNFPPISGVRPGRGICNLPHFLRERENTHEHKQISGIVPALWIAKMWFLGGHSLWGEETHKQNPPENRGKLFYLQLELFFSYG